MWFCYCHKLQCKYLLCRRSVMWPLDPQRGRDPWIEKWVVPFSLGRQSLSQPGGDYYAPRCLEERKCLLRMLLVEVWIFMGSGSSWALQSGPSRRTSLAMAVLPGCCPEWNLPVTDDICRGEDLVFKAPDPTCFSATNHLVCGNALSRKNLSWPCGF